MSYEELRTGQRVTVAGKLGTIREAADKYKIKFDDGSITFADGNEVTPFNDNSSLKGKIYDRMKAENKLGDKAIFMQPTAGGEDPLAQPQRKTGRSVGEEQNVLGKTVNTDVFNQ